MVSNCGTLLARRMQCLLFFLVLLFRDDEKRDWTVLGNTTSHMYDHWQDFRQQNQPSTTLDKGVLCTAKNLFFWRYTTPPSWTKKKRNMLPMHKIRMLCIEESECLIQLWNREQTQLATAATSCIAAKSDCRFYDITWCITKMVLFLPRAVHVQNIFVQPSEFQHLSHFQSWDNTNKCCCTLGW